jgi:hypothetical protein
MSGLSFSIIFDSQGKTGADEQTVDMVSEIEAFRRREGWTRKDLYLVGVVAAAGADDTGMVQQIVEYMSRKKH